MIRVFLSELKRVFTDTGVIIFFLVVPFLYPIFYSWLYNNEVVREVPAIVVDLAHTQMSRELTRRLDASPNVRIVGHEGSVESAKKAMVNQVVRGIILIPESFSRDVLTGKQASVSLYVDMSSMLYYKALLMTLTNITMDMGSKISVSRGGLKTEREEEISAAPLRYEDVPMFNPAGGYGSFLIPAVLILVIQQTMLLGIGLSAGTVRESNPTRSLVSPDEVQYSSKQIIFGKALCYFLVYIVTSSFVLMAVPHMFHFLQLAPFMRIMAILIPYLLACIFFSLTFSCVVRYRENVMLIIIFTSVPLLFMSGISWPGSALAVPWRALSHIFPSTFGINAYVKANSMGASLSDVLPELRSLWIQVGVYFLLSVLVYRIERIRQVFKDYENRAKL